MAVDRMQICGLLVMLSYRIIVIHNMNGFGLHMRVEIFSGRGTFNFFNSFYSRSVDDLFN